MMRNLLKISGFQQSKKNDNYFPSLRIWIHSHYLKRSLTDVKQDTRAGSKATGRINHLFRTKGRSLHILNILRPAYRTDRFLYGTLIDMTTLSAMLMVPDKFINSKILASARGTHDASLIIYSILSQQEKHCPDSWTPAEYGYDRLFFNHLVWFAASQGSVLV